MALSDKDIVITPNKGQSADPKIVFSGADSSTSPQNITLSVYPTNNGMLSFEGSAGQLFSITNSLSGTIYSVNDVSGVPSIEVLDTGLIKLGQYGGNVLLGTGVDNGNKLQVAGGITYTGQLTSTVATGTAPFVVTSTSVVTNLNADLLDGQSGSYYTTAGNLSGTIPSAVLGNSTVYIGTTAVALNRASGNLALAGITSIDGSAASVANSVTFNTSGGAAAGTTYNGSAARTIDYSTVGAAASGHTHYIGTTQVQASSANQAMTGITSITGGTGTTGISFVSANTTSASSGPVNINSGTTTTSGTSGSVTVSSGASAGVSGAVSVSSGTPAAGSASGDVTISSGTSGSTGTGSNSGTISVSSGAAGYNANTTVRNSGNMTFSSGMAYNGTTGTVYVRSGNSIQGGTSGVVYLQAGDSNSTSASGQVVINGGSNSASAAGRGGDVTIKGGDVSSGTTSATGGAVYVYGGSTSSTAVITKTTGSVYIDGGGSGANGTITYGTVNIGTQTPGAIFGTRAVSIGRSGITTTIYGSIAFPNAGTAGTGKYLQSDASGNATWATITAGASISDDTTNSTTYYPLWTTSTTGAPSTIYVSSTKYTFQASTGTLSATNFNSLSDARAKSDLLQITNALDKVKQLTGYTFTMIDSGVRSAGLIAQDAEKVLPESVGGTEDRKTLNYDSLLGLIVEAIKELDNKISVLSQSNKY